MKYKFGWLGFMFIVASVIFSFQNSFKSYEAGTFGVILIGFFFVLDKIDELEEKLLDK